jgi:hypothetical protein
MRQFGQDAAEAIREPAQLAVGHRPRAGHDGRRVRGGADMDINGCREHDSAVLGQRSGTVPRHARLTYLCASSAPSWLRRLLRAPDSIAFTGIVSSCGPTVSEVCANHCRPGSLSCSAPRMCAD